MDACLAVAPDPLPAAWVRLVAIRDSLDVEQTLADLLAKALPALRQQGVTRLAWLTVEEWPCPWLPQWGFYEGSAIETYVKEDDVLPPTSQVPGLLIREVRSTDYEALEALEVAAFTPSGGKVPGRWLLLAHKLLALMWRSWMASMWGTS